MSHGAIDRGAEGGATERSAQLAVPRRQSGGGGPVFVARLRALAAPSVPLSSGGPGDRPFRTSRRTVGADHAQDAREHRPRSAGLFHHQRTDAGRDRDASGHRLSGDRPPAWVSGRSQAGIRFTSPTRSTACSRANFRQYRMNSP